MNEDNSPGTITRITWPTGRRQTCSIEVDGVTLGDLLADVVFEAGWNTGTRLREGEWERWQRESHRRQVGAKFRAWLQRGPRTRMLAMRYLRRQPGLPPEDAERLLNEAQAAGHCNDAQYAQALGRTARRTKLHGPRRIAQDMRRAGVDAETTAKAMEALQGWDAKGLLNAPEGQVDEMDVQKAECCRLLERRKASLMREPDPRRRRQKALRLLLTRGYASAAAWQAIGEVLDDHSKDR